jgi:iron complex transport system permease protein
MSLAMTTARRWTTTLRARAATPRLTGAILLPALAVLLVVAFLLTVGTGVIAIAPDQVVAIIASHLGIHLDIAYTQQQDAVVWAIRLPRALLAVLTGSALAVSGAALQGLFRNPLADPGLVGISSGAALGAVIAIALGASFFSGVAVPVAAALGAVVPAAAVYFLARRDGRTEIVTLILIGIALMAFLGACSALLSYMTGGQRTDVSFWTFGSLGGATWHNVKLTAPFVIAGLLIAPRWRTGLDLFALGEREAGHLGVRTERFRFELLVVTALMTGVTVAAAGVVSFVGLVVPHLIRLVAGPGHRTLLPASALAGAALVLVADLAARTLAAPIEIPLGVVTSIIGGPFLLVLLLRTRKMQGGWG